MEKGYIENGFVFEPPSMEVYDKEELESILDAAACGSNGGTFSCGCYMAGNTTN